VRTSVSTPRTPDVAARITGGPQRRSVPRLLLGVVLVVGCAIGGIVVGQQLGHRESVLVLARSVATGQVLSAQDLREASVSVEAGITVIPVGDEPTVLGQQVAFALPAGAVLTRELIGTPQVPPPGQAVAAVGLKAGQFPPALAPGTRVAVLVAPSGTATAGGFPSMPASSWTATVTDVQRQPNDQITVVSVQLSEHDARQLASTPTGQITVVALNGGGR
jgi:hypothetical protein